MESKIKKTASRCYFFLSASLRYGHPRSIMPRDIIAEMTSQITESKTKI